MAAKVAILFVVITQALGQTSINAGNLVSSRVLTSSNSLSSSQSIATASSSSSSSSSSSGGWSGGNAGSFFQDIESIQTTLNSNLAIQTAALAQAQKTYEEQLNTWYLQSKELQQAFSEAFATVSGLLTQSTTYIQGAQRFVDVIRQSKSGNQGEWSQRVRKLQGLADLCLTKISGSITTILRNVSEISGDLTVYAQAKSQQLIETKVQMDNSLQHLLQQTLEIGKQASGVLTQAENEWSQMLRTHMGANKAGPSISRLREVCEQSMLDMKNLRPEDIETALSDAHRTIEDVKNVFFSAGVPPVVARQTVNHVQVALFASLNRARSLHN